MKRTLAAILVADLVDFTRLMGADEVSTLRRFADLRENVIDALIKEHRGRTVKELGDGMLVVFASVVDAVKCAVLWQERVNEQQSDQTNDERLCFRIGVNLGDVIQVDNDVFGDGVNIAARLEGAAEPGGICISDDAFRQIHGKVDADFKDAGDIELKNVSTPIRVHRWQSESLPQIDVTASTKLPDKPSVAVMPFSNRSGDPEQDYFSDGITEDIIIELSRFHTLFVIARNSSFHYKGRQTTPQQIGSQLGVRYLVEGSVRRVGPRVRVTVELIDALTGRQLWAERYDRVLEDIFAVQDELVRTIVAALGGHIDFAGKSTVARLDETKMRAYDIFLRARAAQDANGPENYAEARRLLERAVKLDPGLAQAHHALSLVYFMQWMSHWVEDREETFERSMKAAQTGVALDPTDGSMYSRLGTLHMNLRNFDESGRCFRKAVELNPNDSQGLALYGVYLTSIGDADAAIEQFDEAIKHNPFEPRWFRWSRGIACFTAGKYDEAIADLCVVAEFFNEARGWLAASYGHAGQPDAARVTLEEFLATGEREMAGFPGRRLADWKDYWHAAIEYRDESHFQHLYDGLRKAGLGG